MDIKNRILNLLDKYETVSYTFVIRYAKIDEVFYAFLNYGNKSEREIKALPIASVTSYFIEGKNLNTLKKRVNDSIEITKKNPDKFKYDKGSLFDNHNTWNRIEMDKDTVTAYNKNIRNYTIETRTVTIKIS